MRLKGPDFATLEEIMLAASDSVRPPERLTVSQAAVRYRELNNPGSYVGPWTNEKTPYAVEVMDTFTSLDYQAVVFVGPARIGKTDILLNWIGHTAICDPADMLVVHMTQNTARDWSQGDLSKMFRHSPQIGAKVAPGRHNRNVHDVRFSSGMRLLIKWPTITELSGKTVPRVMLTDYDRMPMDIDKEGPPFDLAMKRTQTFKRYGMTVAESSPGRDITTPQWVAKSAHEAPPTTGILELYNRGDRRRWYWRCPFCKHSFEPDFKLLNYPSSVDPKDAAEQVTMACPHCSMDIEPSYKAELNAKGRWLRDGQIWMPDNTIVGAGSRSNIASFWLKGPAAAFQDWSSIVEKYLRARAAFEKTQDEGPLKATVNTDQGLPYLPQAVAATRLPEELKARAQDWGGSQETPVVPIGTRFLVATIDVQAGSRAAFVVQVHGIGVNGDVYLVDMFRIRKSNRVDQDGVPELIDPASYLEDWQLLVPEVIERTYPLGDGSGRRMSIKFTGCDSGGKAGVTTNAYNFWRRLRDENDRGHHARFLLIKGEPSKSAPRVRLGYPDSNQKDRNSGARGDVPVLFINSTQVKDMAYGMLGRTEPRGGAVFFPHWAPDWLYTQLTAEVRTDKGWDPTQKRRNEAWDLLYYCLGLCLHSVIRIEHIDWENPPGWAKDWDQNDLVFDPTTTKAPFEIQKKVDYDLAALASALA